MTDARGLVTSYAYDEMDRTLSRTDQLQGASSVKSYEYDKAGNLSRITDRRGKVVTYSYDALNRRTFAGFGMTGGPNYESTISYTYDGYGRITQAVDSASGTITRDYDDLTRTMLEVTAQGTISYGYDKVGRLTSQMVGGQPAVSYAFDDADRLTGITQGTATIGLAYDNANRRTSVTLPNGVVTEYGYDDASELTSLTYKNGATVLGDLVYEYDTAGRRTRISGSYARTGLPQTFGSSAYNDANQLTQQGPTSYVYDASGNLINDGMNTYTWNARNQLTSISGGLIANFQYDAFGRRISKTVNGASTTYHYDGANVAQELSGATPTANMLNGGLDELFLRNDSGGTWTYLRDGLNGTLALLDSTGTVQSQYTYDPFGKTEASGGASDNSNQYTGRENDQTGLYYSRARYYSPKLQRFISEDPVGITGGINLYAYVGNDPVNASDPQGLWPSRSFGPFGGRIHQRSAERMLGSMLSDQERMNLEQGLSDADWQYAYYQSEDMAYMHAMAPSRGSKDEARAEANRFIKENLDKAKMYPPSPYQYYYLGLAMHTMQDYTSPAHHGFQRTRGGFSFSHYLKEEFDPGVGSNLDMATMLAYHHFMGRPIPEDVFSELGCDCPPKVSEDYPPMP